MKVTLEFNFPEEKNELELAIKAGEMSSILEDIASYARSLRKYEERESIPTDEVVQKLYELIARD